MGEVGLRRGLRRRLLEYPHGSFYESEPLLEGSYTNNITWGPSKNYRSLSFYRVHYCVYHI